jgi:hypothetical protein
LLTEIELPRLSPFRTASPCNNTEEQVQFKKPTLPRNLFDAKPEGVCLDVGVSDSIQDKLYMPVPKPQATIIKEYK